MDGPREGGGSARGGEGARVRLDPVEVRRIARLARLELEEPEVERLAVEMGGVLRRFEELEAAEAAAGEREEERGAGAALPPAAEGGRERGGPTEEPEAGSPGREPAPAAREDVPGPDPLAAGPDRFAPDWREGFFVVPRLPALADPSPEAATGEDGPAGEQGVGAEEGEPGGSAGGPRSPDPGP